MLVKTSQILSLNKMCYNYVHTRQGIQNHTFRKSKYLNDVNNKIQTTKIHALFEEIKVTYRLRRPLMTEFQLYFTSPDYNSSALTNTTPRRRFSHSSARVLKFMRSTGSLLVNVVLGTEEKIFMKGL